MKRHPSCGDIRQARMQDYQWHALYNGIFIIWAIGYLMREELVAFLRRAKSRLMPGSAVVTRRSVPESFIFILDNVFDYTVTAEMLNGQMLRTRQELESIFKEANLAIHQVSEPYSMPESRMDVQIWALY